MEKVSFHYNYFLDVENEGNASLTTPEDRINDACKLFKNGVEIQFVEDGTMVSNEFELRLAIDSFKKKRISEPKVNNVQQNNNVSSFHHKRPVLAIVFFLVAFLSILFWGIVGQHEREFREETIYDNTTETVYKTSRGSEVIICDNGVAYIDGNKGTWRVSHVTIGNRSGLEFCKISLNGSIYQGAIFEGKYYFGRDAYQAIKDYYPDGQTYTRSRR